MGVEVRYVCDRCGHTQGNDNQMWKVRVMVGSSSAALHTSSVRKEALWCRQCCDETQVLVPALSPVPLPAAEEPTIEDMIRQIVREEMYEVSNDD